MLRQALLGLCGAGLLGGCASYRLKRELRRKDLVAVQASSPKTRAQLSPKWRRRYAQLLAERGQIYAARLWWLGSYLRGADLQALESLAVSHARAGEQGFAAAQFAQLLATERDAITHPALACEAWGARKAARVQAGAFVSAQRDERRLRARCGHPGPDVALAKQAAAERLLRAGTPKLIKAFGPALTPAFLNPESQTTRLDRRAVALELANQDELAPQQAAATVAANLVKLLESDAGRSMLGPWLSADPRSRTPAAAKELLRKIGQDPLLGDRAAGLCALLGAAGHDKALTILKDNLRASSNLQSEPSAKLRVILALVHGTRESAIFWMRLGASQAQDLGQWWLWCARWAQFTGQGDATKVAYQSLTKLVAPQSPARWTLSWWRLKQKILEFPLDPYLQTSAPSQVAGASLRAFWNQYLASLPSERVSGVWPTLVDALVLAHWSDEQILHLGSILFEPSPPSEWERAILVSRAKLRLVQEQPEQALALENPSLRGAAWRRIWSKAGVNAGSIAQYWERMALDPAWSPRVDPFAALSVLFSRPSRWSGQD